MLVHLCLSVPLTIISHIIFICTITYELINDDDDDDDDDQCLQCVNAALTHVEIPRPRDATELDNDGVIKLGNVHDPIC